MFRLSRTVLVVASLGWASAVQAQGAEPTEAELVALRQLFAEGKELESTGQWEAALEKFRKVGEAKMTPQVRFHVSLCEENLGRLVRAVNGFELALEEARQVGAAEVLSAAPPRIADLRARIPLVTLRTVEPLPNTARVKIDKTDILPALVGAKIPLDLGKHTVEVLQGSSVVFAQEITLTPGQTETIDLFLEDASRPPQAPVSQQPAEGNHALTIVTASVAAASLIGAGVFFGLRQSAIHDVRETCDDNDQNCSPYLRDRAREGEHYTWASVALGTVGVGAGAAALYLWLHKPTPESKTSVWIAPTLTSASVVGRF